MIKMNNIRVIARFATLQTTMSLAIVAPVQALMILTKFVPSGGSLPGIGIASNPAMNTSGAGNLNLIFEAAAEKWQSLISDEFTLRLSYGWYPTAPISNSAYHQGTNMGGNPPREQTGTIAFNNASTQSLFLDPTPHDNVEFGAVIQNYIDLRSGPVNVKQEYSGVSRDAIGRVDLLSVAMHEIGHALGLVGWSFYQSEVADGDIDVTLPILTGTTIPVLGTHLDISGPLMSRFGRPLGHRTDVSQVDLLAICEVSNFQQCALSDGDYNGDGAVDAADYVVWRISDGTQIGYGIWRARFGETNDNGAVTNALIPEPESGWLLILAMAIVLLLERVLKSPKRK